MDLPYHLIQMYNVFKKQDNTIWKVEPVLVPEQSVSYWSEAGGYLTKEDLETININIIK